MVIKSTPGRAGSAGCVLTMVEINVCIFVTLKSLGPLAKGAVIGMFT